MSLRFSYLLKTFRQPIVPLGGRLSRPRPIIPVTISGPARSYLKDALLDTGSEDTVFPEDLAVLLGINLTNAPQGLGGGIGMGHYTIRYAQVDLRISDGVESRKWRAWVGFTSANLRQPLLSYAGFLQFFTASFHGDLEQVELTVNGLYPSN